MTDGVRLYLDTKPHDIKAASLSIQTECISEITEMDAAIISVKLVGGLKDVIQSKILWKRSYTNHFIKSWRDL